MDGNPAVTPLARHFDDIDLIVAQQEEFVRQGQIASAAHCLPLIEAHVRQLASTAAQYGSGRESAERLQRISGRYTAMQQQIEQQKAAVESALGQAAGRARRARSYAVAEAC